MAINQILPFGTVAGANVLAPAEYQALAARTAGFSAGTAKSKELNTVWRQASFVTAMIAQYIADKGGQDVLDNGDLAALQAKFVAALAASPTFTGVPQAPTAAAGASTDQIATTRFVTQQLASTIPWMNQANLPTTDKGPIYVVERKDIWTWVSTSRYTGYRSALCGAVEHGHTVAPLPWQLDATGGRVPKASYPQLVAYAQENGLLVPAASWVAGALRYGDEGDQLRLPDLQNMFLRFTGTDADTAGVRTLGSWQAQKFERHVHQFSKSEGAYTGGSGGSAGWLVIGVGGGATTDPTGGNETRPVNAALAPRLHV